MALMSRRVVHIHPTLLCNLACAHCYSSSSPAEKAGLPYRLVLEATAGLRGYGYDVASISGGEPTVYRDLEPLCMGLQDQGFGVSIISNGLLPDRVRDVAQTIRPDLLSISFDGLEPRHDAIRLRKGSFARAMESLQVSVAAGQRTGAVVSFADEALEDLPELIDRLVTAGVQHVQFHPLSQVGRAKDGGLQEPSPETMLRVLVLARVLEAVHEGVSIDCDALPGVVLAERDLPVAGDVVSPLVLGHDGRVWPLAYGLPEVHGFGGLGGPLKAPVYSEALAQMVAQTARDCAGRAATAFYPDLVRHAVALDTRRPAVAAG